MSDDEFLGAVVEGDVHRVRAWLREGGSPHIRDARGWTALMLAAMGGFVEIVRTLIEEGVDVNARSRDGSSAVLEAALWRHPHVVHILLSCGADQDAKADNGWTARAVLDQRRREHGLGATAPSLTPNVSRDPNEEGT